MSPTATPFAPAAMSAPCGGASTTEDVNFDGLFDFVMRNFHYRYVNVHDYVTEYSASPTRPAVSFGFVEHCRLLIGD